MDTPHTATQEIHMSDSNELVALFTEKARAVSAVVSEISTMEGALSYAIDLCEQKEACQILYSGCEGPLSEPAERLCKSGPVEKIIAAPGMDDETYLRFSTKCRERDIVLIRDGLRTRLGGLDVGFTVADYGIADTGTLVLASESEELRLATMISEVHIAVLPKSRIRATSDDLEAAMKEWANCPLAYTAWITGASRTADIERVLALGVHGPLELHILICEG